MTYFIDRFTGKVYAASHSSDTGEIETWDEITPNGWQSAERQPARRFDNGALVQLHPNAVEALRPGMTL